MQAETDDISGYVFPSFFVAAVFKQEGQEKDYKDMI